MLYFAPRSLQPANTGSRLRDYYLAHYLATRSHLIFIEMREMQEQADCLPREGNFADIVTLRKGQTYSFFRIVRGLVGPTPVTVLNCWSLVAAASLAEVLRSGQFDTVQVGGVHLARYLPLIRNAASRPAIVVDWHNIESELMWRYAVASTNPFKRAAAMRTAKLLERLEAEMLDSVDTHTVVSERERQKLLARRPSANIQVVPNGVDIEQYSTRAVAPIQPGCARETKRTLLFVGSMDYHANIDAVTWFARTAWPQIALQHPELDFMIVGRNPSRDIQALASERIRVTGTVDDVRPFYSEAIAVIVPLRSGSGTRLKILEAMAAGVPIVSTHLGAEGIDATDDVHLILADSAPQIAAAVARLATSPETRARLAVNARKLVTRYDWQSIGDRLYRIHCSHVPRKQADRVGTSSR